MKLHLPSGLRKALMACLAAVAFALPTTLSSASLGAGALAALALVHQQAEAAVTSDSTVDKDASHRELTTDEVTYSGDIWTWHADLSSTYYTSTPNFSEWTANEDGTGMQDGELKSTNQDALWAKFIAGRDHGGLTYDTLRITGSTSEMLTTSGMTTQGNSAMGLGGLIVESGNDSGYTISLNSTTNSARQFALFLGAGTGHNTFEALVLSSITFTNIRETLNPNDSGGGIDAYVGVTLSSGANIRIAKGKKMQFDAVFAVADGKTLNLTSVGAEEGNSIFQVNSFTLGERSGLDVGAGVSVTLTGGMTVGDNGRVTLGGEGAELVVVGDAEHNINPDLWSGCMLSDSTSGSLILSGIDGDYDTAHGDESATVHLYSLLQKLLHARGTTGSVTKSVGSLVLRDSTVFSIYGMEFQDVLGVVNKIVVEAGSTLWLGAAAPLSASSAPEVVLYGDGTNDSLRTYGTYADAAFSVRALTLAGENAAVINSKTTGSGSTITSLTVASGNTGSIIKKGTGRLNINAITAEEGANTAAGVIDIREGSVQIGGDYLSSFLGRVQVASGATVIFNPGDGQELRLDASKVMLPSEPATSQGTPGPALVASSGTVKWTSQIDASWGDLNLFQAVGAGTVLELDGVTNVSTVSLNNGDGIVRFLGDLNGADGHTKLTVKGGSLTVGGNIAGYSEIEVQNRDVGGNRVFLGSMTVEGTLTMNDGGTFNLNHLVSELDLQGGLEGSGNLFLIGGGTLKLGGTINHSGSIEIRKITGADIGTKYGRIEITSDASSLGGGIILSGAWNVEDWGEAEQPYQLILSGDLTTDKVLKKITFKDADATASAVKVTGKWKVEDLVMGSGKTLTFAGTETGSVTFGNDSGGANVGEGGILSLNSGTYSGKLTVTINNGNGDSAATGGQIALGEGVGLQNLEIILTGSWVDSLGILSDPYNLFSGMTSELLEEVRVSLESSIRQSLTDKNLWLNLNDQGQLVVQRIDEVELVWTSTDGTWQRGGETNWKNGEKTDDHFVEGDKVKFTAEESGFERGGTVTVVGSVAPGKITIDGGEWTFTAGEGGSVSVGGEGIVLAGEAPAATFNLPVSFAGASNITGAGTVELAAGGFNGTGFSVGEGVTVVVSDKASQKTLSGGIVLKDGGTLTLDLGVRDESGITRGTVDSNYTNSWNITNKVTGEQSGDTWTGTLVLENVDGYWVTDDSAHHHSIGLMELLSDKILPGSGKIGTLVLRNSFLSAYGVAHQPVLAKVEKIVVESGSMFWIGQNSVLGGANSPSLELHATESEDALTAALQTFASVADVTISNAVTLVADEGVTEGIVQIDTVAAGNNVGVAGAFTMDSSITLRKTGAGSLTLQRMVTGENHAGILDIQGGTLQINGLAAQSSEADIPSPMATEVKLSAESTHFKLGGEASYTVGTISFNSSAGNDGSGDNITPTTYVDLVSVNEAEPTLSVGTLNLQKNGRITGVDGTLKVTDAVTGGLNLRVQGATLDVSEAETKNMTGGLYLYNSATLKIGDDWSLAFLGASGASDGVSSGGSITTEAEAATLTLTGNKGADGAVTPHTVRGLSLGDKVTLKLGEGVTQKFIELNKNSAATQSKLELAAGATAVFRRDTEDANSRVNHIGSVINAGSVQLKDGGTDDTNANLTVHGELKDTKEGNLSVKGASTLTVEGNLVHNSAGDIVIDNSLAKLYVHGGISGTADGDGVTTGKIQLVRGGLTIYGGNTNDDFAGMLEMSNGVVLTLGHGSDAAGYLTVAGLQNETHQTGRQTITGNGTLELNVAENGDGGVNGAGMNILLEGSTTLKKSGAGIQKLSRLSTSGEDAKVDITEGTLQIVAPSQGGATLSVGNLVVEGENAKLDIAVSGLTASGTNITLSNGGTLSDSAGDGDYVFGKLVLGEGNGSIEYSTAGTNQRYIFTQLSGGGNMDLGEALTGEATGRTLNLGDIAGYTGSITGAVSGQNHLYISGNITTGGLGTSGSINLTGGSVELAGFAGILRKTDGEGVFTISNLKLTGGQSIQMISGGSGELIIRKLSFDDPITLVYTTDAVNNGAANFVGLKIEDIVASLKEINGGSGNYNYKIILDTTAITDRDNTTKIYLGITGDSHEGDYAESELWKYFEEKDALEDDFTLSWVENQLVMTQLGTLDTQRYWDANWDDGSKENGPHNKRMTDHGNFWYNAAEGSGEWTRNYEGKDATAKTFMEMTFALGSEEGAVSNNNGQYSMRFGKGSGRSNTLLTLIGGELSNDPDAAGKETTAGRGVYLSLTASTDDHFHSMVGGSSFVQNSTAGSFSGNTHIQVQGGIVDFLIGGNHMTWGGGTFEGDTYISVYEGRPQLDEETGDVVLDENGNVVLAAGNYRSVVRGGIVGGSTITGTGGDSEFSGHSHIYVYTVLQTDNGMSTIGDGTRFSHIVGGNVWLFADGRGEEKMDFVGSSTIQLDFSGYQAHFFGEDPANAYLFGKAIVGGNYTAGELGEGSRESSFEFRRDLAGKHTEYGSEIIIDGHSDVTGQDITFRGGINGASRRDTSGTEITTYTGKTHVTLDGGIFTNYVAGGFWFGGMNYSNEETHEVNNAQIKQDSHLNGDTLVEIEDGSFWRVAGGSVTLSALEGSTGEHTGSTSLTIKGGRFNVVGGTAGSAPLPGFVAGASFYNNSLGTYTQSGASELTIEGGVFGAVDEEGKTSVAVSVVGGDYVTYGADAPKKTGDGAPSYTVESTQVVIGTVNEGGAASGPDIRGIVVGGSYMEDVSAGGTLRIEGGTNVTINGGTITAKNAGATLGSDRLAIVAGSMLVDTGESGGHAVEIGGSTNLTVNGGTITGYVVGGSYSSSTDNGQGGNSVNLAGEIDIDLKGGTIIGNLIGGHYSDNTHLPSALALGKVTITLEGTDLEGYIFGGSYRRAQTEAAGSPTQGVIEIDLLSGSVAGGVYAAGNHLLVGKNANLRERTTSTKIKLTGDVEIKNSTFAQAGSQVALSGGYQRALKSSAGGTDGYQTDYSTVGYDEEKKSWNENAAVLEFSSEGENDDFSSLRALGSNLYLQDLDTIDVNEGLDVKLEGAHMRVMHKVTKDAAGKLIEGEDVFTKGGKGNLTLGTLWSWHAQETGDAVYGGREAAYTGKIILGGGTLTLTGDEKTVYEQSLEGGLMINMNGRVGGNVDEAYLKGVDDTVFTGLDKKKKIELELVAREFTPRADGQIYKVEDFKLSTGMYYLIDGLEIPDAEANMEEYFHVSGLKGEDQKEEDQKEEDHLLGEGLQYELVVRDGDKLVLRIFKYDTNEWRWEGAAKDNVWKSGGNTLNWTKDGGENKKADDYSDDLTYYFDAGAAYSGDVYLEDGIRAKEIHVESGDYTFKLRNGGTGLSVDTIQIGAVGTANLTLAMETSRVDSVELLEGGRLTLADEGAIQEETTIVFDGGTLAYGEDKHGDLLVTGDYSSQAKLAQNYSGALRIQVGDEVSEEKPVETDPNKGVTWSKDIDLAVSNGIIKSGRMNFTLDWTPTEDANAFGGTLDAQGGVLTLKVNGSQAATINGNAALAAAKGATVELIAVEGGSLTVGRGATGEGTIAIGSATAENQGSYILNTPVDDAFAGTVKLAGDGANSTVDVQDVAALGKKADPENGVAGSTLALAGRAIVVSGSGATISAETITVEKDTTNFLGGYENLTDPNKAITLEAGDGGIAVEGVLANVGGGVNHTLEGTLSGGGMIVAGYQDRGAGEESTWSLTGTQVGDVTTGFAGTGKIIVAYEDVVESAPEGAKAAEEKQKVVRLTGIIGDAEKGDSVALENKMTGIALAIADGNDGKTYNTSTGDLVFNGNEIWLGDDDGTAGSWSGTTLTGTDGVFRLKSGALKGEIGEDKGSVKLVVDTAAAGATVDAGGTDGSRFDEININAGGHLTNVNGDIEVGSGETKMALTFDENSIGGGKGTPEQYLISTNEGDLNVHNTVEEDEEGSEEDPRANDAFSLDVTAEALIDMVTEHRAEGVASYLHAVTGGEISFKDLSDEALNTLLRSGNYTGLLHDLGWTLGVDGGDLTLLGSSAEVYLVLKDDNDPRGDKAEVKSDEDVKTLRGKKATLLDSGTTLTLKRDELTDEEEVDVNNLVGLSGSTLRATGIGTVNLNNVRWEEGVANEDKKWLGDEGFDDKTLESLKGQNTDFYGCIVGENGANFNKKGAGTLTVGDGTFKALAIDGDLKLSGGDFVVRSGAGEYSSTLGSLTFAYGKDATVGDGFVVKGGRIEVGAIVEEAGSKERPIDASKNKVTLADGGIFAFTGKMAEADEEAETPEETLTSTKFGGAGTLEIGGEEGEDGARLVLGSGDGTNAAIGGDLNVQLGSNGILKLKDGATMNAGEVALAGTLDMSAMAAPGTAQSLIGDGTLKGSESNTGLTIDGTPGDEAKAFGGTLEGGGTLTVGSGAEWRIKGLQTKPGDEKDGKWNLEVAPNGTLDVTLQRGRVANLGDVTLGDNSTLFYHYNNEAGHDARTLLTGELKVADENTKANLKVDMTNFVPGRDGVTDLTLGGLKWTNKDLRLEDHLSVTLEGAGKQYFTPSAKIDDDSVVYVDFTHTTKNLYRHADQEKNAAAGAELFWGVDDPLTPLGKDLRDRQKDGEWTDLYKFATALGSQYEGKNIDSMLAAGAGASISTLGQALGDDLHRQINSIRNRTTVMGAEARYDQYDVLPLYHMWVNGETGYHKLDSDGLAPGYTLNSWGGTLGLEMDVTRNVTVGLALSAMYGDLKTEAADSGSGDLDTTYMSAFMSARRGAWRHTVVLSGGMADVKFNRTVGYSTSTIFGAMPGSYKTSGSTDGYAVGALYEIGYTRMANAAGTVAVQPVFNVEYRRVGINGYTEAGSDAALRVDDITQDSITFGAGARVQALTGGNVFNRSAIFEGRALLKVEAGDRSGKAINAIVNTQKTAELESAEVGAVGVEVGAGITIPLGSTEGSIFIDGSLELRSGYTSMDATVGYRVSF